MNHGMNQEVVNLDTGQKITLRMKQVLQQSLISIMNSSVRSESASSQ